MLTVEQLSTWQRAAPFWASFIFVPLAWFGASYGGWTLLLVPFAIWYLFIALDGFVGLDLENANPQTPDNNIQTYILLTKLWVPAQFLTLFGLIWFATHSTHLSTLERVGLFFGMGVISGTIGINYSHELMHQKPKLERWLADILLAMVMYSHFRSEHLLVHHRYVGTPRDPVTARYNESFFRYYPRVLWGCLKSAFNAEARMMRRKGLPWFALDNPFWRYAGLQLFMVTLAVLLGGWSGLVLFLIQAGVAFWQLELVNYIEHYGLTRKHLGDGKYEHVLPRHSWNSAQKASNWLLINLQRHSDHHYKPDRRFPLLQNHSEDDAPQLPYGYPVMTLAAMIPPLWRRIMNPKVRAWRKKHYPEIEDWAPYNKQTLPLPR
jgi:alkane 1-monooxygenase